MELAFENEVRSILAKYKESSTDDPLDGDEAERLISHLRNTLNLLEGNITEEEYLENEEMAKNTIQKKVIDDVIKFLTFNLEELEYREERVTGETEEGQADIKEIKGLIRRLKKMKENGQNGSL